MHTATHIVREIGPFESIWGFQTTTISRSFLWNCCFADATVSGNSLTRAQALKAPRANAVNDAEFVSIPFLAFTAIVFSMQETNI